MEVRSYTPDEKSPLRLHEGHLRAQSHADMTKDTRSSRRFRAVILWSVVAFLCVSLWSWHEYFRPGWEEGWEFREGFMMNSNELISTYKKHKFDGTWLEDLDAALLPGGEADSEGKRRLIFVGDIHGCAYELKKLLEKVEFSEKTDHLIAVGDLISKGPASAEVLDELIRINASSVRGNHEDRILALVPAILESGVLPSETDVKSDRFASDSKLLHELSKEHLNYLRDMPLMLRIPPLPQAVDTTHRSKSPIGEEILVVHAGLVPAVSLEKQDPYFVMNMRSIHTKSHHASAEAESKKDKTKAWHDIWCWYNDRLFRHKSLKDFQVWEDQPASSEADLDAGDWFSWLGSTSTSKKYPDPQVVIYGHRSKEGLQIERWTKGLDTGCVKGEQLTALVLDAKGKEKIVQVDCKDYR